MEGKKKKKKRRKKGRWTTDITQRSHLRRRSAFPGAVKRGKRKRKRKKNNVRLNRLGKVAFQQKERKGGRGKKTKGGGPRSLSLHLLRRQVPHRSKEVQEKKKKKKKERSGRSVARAGSHSSSKLSLLVVRKGEQEQEEKKEKEEEVDGMSIELPFSEPSRHGEEGGRKGGREETMTP